VLTRRDGICIVIYMNQTATTFTAKCIRGIDCGQIKTCTELADGRIEVRHDDGTATVSMADIFDVMYERQATRSDMWGYQSRRFR
jgi:hypothetical protein